MPRVAPGHLKALVGPAASRAIAVEPLKWLPVHGPLMAAASLGSRFRPSRELALLGGALLALEALAVAVFLLVAPVTVHDPLILVYPLVWINVGLWAAWRTEPPAAAGRRRLAVGLLAAAYFAVLAVVGGLVDLSHLSHGHVHAPRLRIAYATLPPGFGPALLYSGPLVGLTLLPYKVVGYLVLAYLVYATVLEAAGSALSGLLGLFSCVSCAWPVLGTVVAGLFGSGSAIYAFAISESYLLSTLVFVSAVALLRWRPSIGPPAAASGSP